MNNKLSTKRFIAIWSIGLSFATAVIIFSLADLTEALMPLLMKLF